MATTWPILPLVPGLKTNSRWILRTVLQTNKIRLRSETIKTPRILYLYWQGLTNQRSNSLLALNPLGWKIWNKMRIKIMNSSQRSTWLKRNKIKMVKISQKWKLILGFKILRTIPETLKTSILFSLTLWYCHKQINRIDLK